MFKLCRILRQKGDSPVRLLWCLVSSSFFEDFKDSLILLQVHFLLFMLFVLGKDN